MRDGPFETDWAADVVHHKMAAIDPECVDRVAGPSGAHTALPVRVRSSRQLMAAPAGWAGRTESNAVVSASATPWAPARVTTIGSPDTRLASAT